MPYADPEQRRIHGREYRRRAGVAEQRREYNRAYYIANCAKLRGYARVRRSQRRAHNREYAREWRAENPEYTHEYNRTLKVEALAAYGGPVCVRCGDTDFDRLELDHVLGNGGDHRRQLLGNPRAAGSRFYRKMRDLDWPNDPPLQVLCGTCNKRKQKENGEWKVKADAVH